MDITDLFSTDQWPARWHCGQWSEIHGWTYIISDIMIGLAYVAIPLIILRYFLLKKSALRFGGTYLLFASFIMLCGTTHFIDAIMFWLPVYRFNALVLAVTACVSIATVIHLVNVLPLAFKLKTSNELEAEIAKRVVVEEKLAEANQNIHAFAYAASHDLKEPLRKIGIFSSQLADLQKSDEDDSRSNELIRKIFSSSQKMQRLIDDLLNLASINDSVKFERVDTNVILEEVLEELEIKINDKQASVIIEKGIPPVLGEPAYLRQLFVNLITNALKFNNSIPEIKITYAVIAGFVEIRISDNGIGMKPEMMESIFEPFIRLQSKTKFEGSGIGLAIVKRIIVVHQGAIRVESAEGLGSVFIVSLAKAD